MNVADLKHCKELFELSGWGDITYEYSRMQKRVQLKGIHAADSAATPAYDAGFLLRKLPHTIGRHDLAMSGGDGDHPTNRCAELTLPLINQYLKGLK